MIYVNGKKAEKFQMNHTAIALGKFDGIHIGHQLLMAGLKKAKTEGKNTLVFSFGTPPDAVLKGRERKNIYTTMEKVNYFEQFCVDVLLEYPFTKEFAAMSPELFVTHCLVNQLGVEIIYVGEDFRFGKERSGDVGLLKKLGRQYGFLVCEISKKKTDGQIVSSTSIRKLLQEDFALANRMLGNPYFVYSEVVHGKHLGNTIGFPTVNQVIPEYKVVPQKGVYASRIWIDGKVYYGISNLGVKPTIAGVHKMGLETYIFDFHEDVYGKKIKTELLEFIRKEVKFDGLEQLVSQIQKDILICKEKILDKDN